MKYKFLNTRFYFSAFLYCKRNLFFSKRTPTLTKTLIPTCTPVEFISKCEKKTDKIYKMNRRILSAYTEKGISSVTKKGTENEQAKDETESETKTKEKAEAKMDVKMGVKMDVKVEVKEETKNTETKNTETKTETIDIPNETIRKKYKQLYVFYYMVFTPLCSFFLYCIIKLMLLIFNEPPFLHMIKEKVLSDSQLIEEYEEIKFSKFWTGHVNSDDARVIFNIRSKTKKTKKGRIICTLKKIKNDEWKIITLTYYDSKRNENLKTDDLKTLANSSSLSSCPIDHSKFRTKNS